MKKIVSLIVAAMFVLPALAFAQEDPCPGEGKPEVIVRPGTSKEKFRVVKKKAAKKAMKKASKKAKKH